MTKFLLTFFGMLLIGANSSALTLPTRQNAASTIRSAASVKTATSIKPAAIDIADVPLMDTPLYNPEGQEENWIMNVTENSYFGTEEVDGYKMAIRRSNDGKTIYFRDLTPGFNGDANTDYAWVEGTINGNDITIKCGQVLYLTDNQALYLEAVTTDEWGQVEAFLPEFHLTIEDDKIVQPENNIYLSVYDHAETIEEAGFFIFMKDFAMMPFGEVMSFNPPASAEIEKWMLTTDSGSRFVNVAMAGDTVYVAGLSNSAPDDFIPGTIKDGLLSFKSGYILSSNPQKYVRLIGAHTTGYDEYGYPQLEMTMTFDFEVNADNTSFTMTPAEDYIADASYFNFVLLDGISNAKFFHYAGDVAATPATPEILDWNEEDGILRINVPCADVDGNFINPELLTYRILLDGTPHVLTPDEYFYLTEEMVNIPYSFTDNYDIYSNSDVKTIYLHAPEFSSLAVISTYTVNDDERDSAPGELAAIDGIAGDNSPVVSEELTDIMGRRITTPAPGTLIIRKAIHADGSVSVSKEIAR